MVYNRKHTKQYVVIDINGELYEGYAVKSYIYLKVALNKAQKYANYSEHQIPYLGKRLTDKNKDKIIKKHLKIIELDFITMTMNEVCQEEMIEVNNKIDEFNNRILEEKARYKIIPDHLLKSFNNLMLFSQIKNKYEELKNDAMIFKDCKDGSGAQTAYNLKMFKLYFKHHFDNGNLE